MKSWLSKEYKIAHKVLLLIAIPLVFQYVFVIVLAYLLEQSEKEIVRERHAREVIAEANSLLSNFMTMGALVYLKQSSEKSVFKDKLDDAFRNIPQQLENLRILIRESPNYERDKKIVARLCDDGIFIVNESQEILKKGNRSKGINNPVFGLVSRLNGFLSDMRKFAHDQEVLESKEPERGKLARLRVILWLMLGLVLNTGIAIYLAIVFNKNALSRLNTLIQNTQLFKSNKSLNPLVSGSDEIALLDSAFHQMADDIHEISERKRELQAMVTHDLRTPLTSIRLSLSLLIETMQSELPAKVNKVINTAERNCSRLIRLINDLLDIEKLESGQFVLNKTDQHLALVFEAVEEATSEFAASKSIEIVVSDTGSKIEADGDRLVQVIVNLVSNAIKFSDNGKKVYIDAAENGPVVEISVKDEGRGIPAEALPKLFERFHQVSAKDGARGKGTGLGLSIAKALVEAHEGKVEVESELGVGTTFKIILPLKKAVSKEEL